jgi:hypothetical protein
MHGPANMCKFAIYLTIPVRVRFRFEQVRPRFRGLAKAPNREPDLCWTSLNRTYSGPNPGPVQVRTRSSGFANRTPATLARPSTSLVASFSNKQELYGWHRTGRRRWRRQHSRGQGSQGNNVCLRHLAKVNWQNHSLGFSAAWCKLWRVVLSSPPSRRCRPRIPWDDPAHCAALNIVPGYTVLVFDTNILESFRWAVITKVNTHRINLTWSHEVRNSI